MEEIIGGAIALAVGVMLFSLVAGVVLGTIAYLLTFLIPIAGVLILLFGAYKFFPPSRRQQFITSANRFIRDQLALPNWQSPEGLYRLREYLPKLGVFACIVLALVWWEESPSAPTMTGVGMHDFPSAMKWFLALFGGTALIALLSIPVYLLLTRLVRKIEYDHSIREHAQTEIVIETQQNAQLAKIAELIRPAVPEDQVSADAFRLEQQLSEL